MIEVFKGVIMFGGVLGRINMNKGIKGSEQVSKVQIDFIYILGRDKEAIVIR